MVSRLAFDALSALTLAVTALLGALLGRSLCAGRRAATGGAVVATRGAELLAQAGPWRKLALCPFCRRLHASLSGQAGPAERRVWAKLGFHPRELI